MRMSKARIAAITATAAVIVGASNIPATAADQPETTTTSLPANSVTSKNVKEASLYQSDVNPNVVNLFRTPKANSVGSWNTVDGSLQLRDLSQETKYVLRSPRLNSIGSAEVKDGHLGLVDLQSSVRQAIQEGKITGVESDGPYPGATDLGSLEGQGDNSDALVKGDEGASVQDVWVKCAPGKTALGGGYHVAADNTLAAKKAIQVVASEPLGETIEGDAAQSIRPVGWRVEVINNGATDVIVRPWVTCVKVG